MYRVILASHIVAIICWMAGVLYLMRLFVYHSEEPESNVKERFKVMEERLFRIITLPSSIVAFVLGLVLLFLNPELLRQGWMHAKLLFAILLFGLTHYCNRIRVDLGQGKSYSTKKLRILNEVPTILMILIVFLVILRPF